MPNKYEREIEEILRNMERTEPKPGLGQKLGGRIRRKSDSRSNVRRRSEPSLHFGVSEWCCCLSWHSYYFAIHVAVPLSEAICRIWECDSDAG